MSFGYILAIKDRFSASLNKFQDSIQRIMKVGDSVKLSNIAIGASFAAMGVVSSVAIGKIISSAMPLEEAMKRLQTVTSTTFQSMNQAMEMSLSRARVFSSGFSSSTQEIIDSSYQLASAGLNVEQVMAGIESTSRLARAGLGNLSDTAVIMGMSLNTVGKSASMNFLSPLQKSNRIADVMATTVKKFQLTLPILSEGFKFVVGPASSLGIKLTELSGALGILNTSGIRASMAGTTLAQVLQKMGKAREMLNLDPGEFLDAAGNLKSLSSFLEAVNKALPVNKFDRYNKITKIFQARAAKSVIVLLDQLDALKRNTIELDNSKGAAERMSSTIEDTAATSFKILRNNIENAASSIGETFLPYVKILIRGLTSIVKSIAVAPAYIKRFIAGFMAASTAILTTIGVLKLGGIALAIWKSATLASAGANTAHAFSIAAVRAALGDVTALLSVTAVLATAAGFGFAVLGDSSIASASNINYANTSLEGISTTANRVEKDFRVLQNVLEKGVNFNIGKMEVISFADLIDFSDRDRFLKELRSLESSREAVINLESKIGMEQPLTAWVGTNAKTLMNLWSTRVILDTKIKKIKAKLDISQIKEGSKEYEKLRAQILKITKTELAERALVSFANSQREAGSAARNSSVIIKSATQVMKKYGMTLEKDVLLYIRAFKTEYEEAFKKAGVQIPTTEIEKFISDVGLIREELKQLSKFSDVENISVAIEVPKNIKGEMKALYDFATRNIENIRKTNAYAASDMEKGLKLSSGGWAKLGTIVQEGDQGLEEVGKREVFTGDQEKATTAIAAKMFLSFYKSFKSIRDEADKTSKRMGELRLGTLGISQSMQILNQFDERVKTITKSVGKADSAFTFKGLAKGINLSEQHIKKLELTKKQVEAQIITSRKVLENTSASVTERDKVNQELTKSLQLENQLNQKLGKAKNTLKDFTDKFVILGKARLPDFSKQIGLEKKDLELSFTLNNTAKDKIQNEINVINQNIRNIEASKITLGLKLDKKGVDPSKNAEMVKLDKWIVEKKLKLENLQIKMKRLDVSGVDSKLQKEIERLNKLGKITPQILVSASEFKAVKEGVVNALGSALKTGKYKDFATSYGNVMKNELHKGVIEGLKKGFIAAFAIGDIQALGKKLGEALRKGGVEGRNEVQKILAQLKTNVVSLQVRAPEMKRVFGEAVNILKEIDTIANQAGAGLVDFSGTGSRAVDELNNKLAKTATNLQLASSEQQIYWEQLRRLQEGKGLISGIDIAQADNNKRLQIAIGLYRKLSGTRVDPNILSGVRQEIEILNKKLRDTPTAINNINKSVTAPKTNIAQAPSTIGIANTSNIIAKEVEKVKSAIKQVNEITISPTVSIRAGNIESIRNQIKEISNTQVYVNLDINLDKARELITTLNQDVTLDRSISDAETKLDSINSKAREFSEIMSGININGLGDGGTITTGTSGDITVNLGDTQIKVETGIGSNGGATQDQRDEILRRVQEMMDNKLEEVKGIIDKMIETSV